MLSFMGIRLAHINRMRRITQTLVRHGIVQLLEGATGGIDAARAGRRLAQALDELGPTFVKLGQVLSTREDMLPADIQERVHLVEIPAMAISSTDCRERAAEGRPVWYLVPDGVVQYITKNALYA